MITEFKGQYRFLSNFWIVNLRIGDMHFTSAEHAYQAAKSLDQQDWANISSCETPGDAKRAGRLLKLRPDWESIKLDVMEIILKEKFSHPELAHKLVETGDQELIEGNHWGDTFWGVCRNQGQNHLGRLLMKIRSEL